MNEVFAPRAIAEQEQAITRIFDSDAILWRPHAETMAAVAAGNREIARLQAGGLARRGKRRLAILCQARSGRCRKQTDADHQPADKGLRHIDRQAHWRPVLLSAQYIHGILQKSKCGIDSRRRVLHNGRHA